MHGPSVFYDDNTGYLILGDPDPLTDSANPTVPITTATVTCEWIKPIAGGANVAGAAFPIAMPHILGGMYRCKVPDTLVVTPEETYEAFVKTVVGTDIGTFYLRFPARRRVV